MRDLDDKESVSLDGIEDYIVEQLDVMQERLFESAKNVTPKTSTLTSTH